MIEKFLVEARDIRWDELASVHGVSRRILAELDGRRDVLIDTIQQADALPVEHFPNFFKLVLAVDEGSGWSMRLHYFYREAEGSRHSHRWTFAGRVLEGRLLHTIFEADEDYAARAPGTEPMVLIREEQPGSTYALAPVNVHSIRSLQPSLTLVLRGPEVRSSRFVDVPGIERGWSHRYRTGHEMIRRGERVDSAETGEIVEDVIRMLARGAHPNGTSARSLPGQEATGP